MSESDQLTLECDQLIQFYQGLESFVKTMVVDKNSILKHSQ